MDPGSIQRTPLLKWSYDLLGFSSVETFLTAIAGSIIFPVQILRQKLRRYPQRQEEHPIFWEFPALIQYFLIEVIRIFWGADNPFHSGGRRAETDIRL